MAKIRSFILLFQYDEIWLQIENVCFKKYRKAEEAAIDIACYLNDDSLLADNMDFLTAYQICNLITSGYAELVTYYNLDTHKSRKPIFNEFKKYLDLQLKSIEAQVKN